MTTVRITCTNESITGCIGEDVKDCGYCTPCAVALLNAYLTRISAAQAQISKDLDAYKKLALQVLR